MLMGPNLTVGLPIKTLKAIWSEHLTKENSG